jgi:hypothetical protein
MSVTCQDCCAVIAMDPGVEYDLNIRLKQSRVTCPNCGNAVDFSGWTESVSLLRIGAVNVKSPPSFDGKTTNQTDAHSSGVACGSAAYGLGNLK